MRNISEKCCGENPKHSLCSIIFFRKSCRLLDNAEKSAVKATCDSIIRHMRWACFITKAAHARTHTHRIRTQHNTAFPRQQWLP